MSDFLYAAGFYILVSFLICALYAKIFNIKTARQDELFSIFVFSPLFFGFFVFCYLFYEGYSSNLEASIVSLFLTRFLGSYVLGLFLSILCMSKDS